MDPLDLLYGPLKGLRTPVKNLWTRSVFFKQCVKTQLCVAIFSSVLPNNLCFHCEGKSHQFVISKYALRCFTVKMCLKNLKNLSKNVENHWNFLSLNWFSFLWRILPLSICKSVWDWKDSVLFYVYQWFSTYVIFCCSAKSCNMMKVRMLKAVLFST